jgi:hypothetical protein
MKISKKDHDEAIISLRQLLKPGDTVYCVLRNVSRSGMSRSIDLYVMKNNEPRRITCTAGLVLGYPLDRKNDGLKVRGCGMDMGFHCVYSLSHAMFPGGFGETAKLKADSSLTVRPKNPSHAAALCAEGYKFRGRNGDTSGWDNDGGYALNSRWM